MRIDIESSVVKYQSAGRLYSRRDLPLRGRGAYGIHRAFGPRCQGLCSLRSGGKGRGGCAAAERLGSKIGGAPDGAAGVGIEIDDRESGARHIVISTVAK